MDDCIKFGPASLFVSLGIMKSMNSQNG